MGYLPQSFNLKNRYYYDPSLTEFKKGKKLYSKATQITLTNDSSNNLDIMTNINAAISFLEGIKNSERAKEELCIEYYLDILNKQMQETNDIELKNILIKLKKAIEDMNPTDVEQQQALLMQKMSLVRSRPEFYMRRLEDASKSFVNLEEAQLNDPLIGNQTFIQKILTPSSEQNYEQELRNKILKTLEQYSPKNLSTFQEGLVASIAADFRMFLYEQGNLMNQDLTLFNDYLEQNRYLLNLLQTANNDNEKNITNQQNAYNTLLTILEDAENELGIASEGRLTRIHNQIQELKNKKNTIENKEEKKKIQNQINSLNKKKHKIEKMIKEGKLYRIKTDTSHGDIEEVITTLIYRTLSVPGSAAIDHIGSFTIDTNTQDIFPIFQEISQEMQKITNEHVKNRNNLTTYSEKYKQININIQNILSNYKKVKEKNEPLTDFSKMFITNESAKLYWNATNMEHSFTGRNIGIADALAQLYSIDEALMINQDTLIHIIINLSSATAWQHSSLENYLSIFAGLLMFGDIYNMAQEAAQFAQTNLLSEDIHVIHLYNIGEHFVPSSIVLENICNNFKEIANETSSAMSARATINPYQPQVKKNSTEEDWGKASDEALLKTKIKLHFLKGLFNFINEYNLLK